MPTALRSSSTSNKSRPGEMNGHVKLSDREVRLIRLICAAADPPPTLARVGWMFRITARHVKRLCTAQMRPEAGGLIMAEAEAESQEPQINRTKFIRCKGCRGKVNPSLADPELCLRCHQFGY